LSGFAALDDRGFALTDASLGRKPLDGRWGALGDEAALSRFFETLEPRRCAGLEIVSADAAPWIASMVKRSCPQARLCLGPFYGWGTEALDQVRRQVWNAARRRGHYDLCS
jgi:hypothetical protein